MVVEKRKIVIVVENGVEIKQQNRDKTGGHMRRWTSKALTIPLVGRDRKGN
jgi:hypothetical protein